MGVIKVFLWNRRFADLIRFCWQYRREGMVVARKVLLRRSEKLTGAGTGDETTAGPSPDRAEIAAATREWQDWQRVDMARMKKEFPGRGKVVFVEVQRKRPEAPATAR